MSIHESSPKIDTSNVHELPDGRAYRKGTDPDAVHNFLQTLFADHRMTAYEARPAKFTQDLLLAPSAEPSESEATILAFPVARLDIEAQQ